MTDIFGNAVADGETISYSITTGDGQLSASTAATSGGRATVTYTASGTVGVETLRAQATNGVSATVNVTLVAATVASVTVSAGSDEIVADGADRTTISATVVDSAGNNVVDGTTVTFTTTAGDIDFTTAGSQTTYTTTTVNGVAAATLTSPAIVGSTTVTATSGGASGKATVGFIPGPVADINLTAIPNNLSADGTSASTIRAFVTDANGNIVANGETITYSVTTGAGILSAPTASTSNGLATVNYTASDTPGTETIRARAANGVSNTVNVTLVAPTIGSVTLTSGATSIVADGTAQVLITADVKNSFGLAVDDGTAVTFTASAGALSALTATTTNGLATVFLTSPTNVGSGSVTGTSGGVSSSVTVQFIPGPAATASVTASPANLTADGTSTSTLRVTVLDANGNPVANGETVTFTTNDGVLSTLTSTTVNGVVEVTYTAPNFVPAAGSDTVTAETTNGVTGAAVITLIGAQIATITVTASPESIPADGTTQSTISATLTVVGGGNPPDGTAVTFTTTAGSFGALTQTTASTANGVAIAVLTSGTTGGETATVVVEGGGRRTQLQVQFTPGSVSVTITPNSILGTGEQTATVTARVLTASGDPANNTTVTFTLDDLSLGTVSPGSDTTDADGNAETTFTDAAKGGTVTIRATATLGGVDVSGTETITVQPPPAFLEVAEGSPNPASISIKGTGGQSTSLVTFDVKDSQGTLVADGYRIDFAILSGPDGGEEISPLFATTVNGQVSTILTSGFKSGPVSIRARYFHNTNVSTTTGQIGISAGPPVGEEFGIAAEYLNISGLWVFGLEDEISVNAGDIYSNAIPDETSISFKTYNTGGLFNPGSSGTAGGFATSTLFSTDNPTPIQGFVSVTAEAVNGGRTTHVTSVAINPDNTEEMYAGTDGGGIYKSTDGGDSWLNISRSSTTPGRNWLDPYVNDVHIDPDNSNSVYAATGYLGTGHVYRSFDGGANWNSGNTEEFYGAFSSSGAVRTVLCDDGSDYVWIGTQGEGVYLTTDGTATPSITWAQAATGLGQGKTVVDIVKSPRAATGAAAVLYAATSEGVFTSTGGSNWAKLGGLSFTGENIRTLEVFFDGVNDVVYAGTEDAGVWVYSAGAWANFTSGMGKGLSATTPQADITNKGTGVMSEVDVGDDAVSEFWTVTCTATAADGGAFSVVGSVSGAQVAYDITTGGYTAISNVLSFTITDGATDFAAGDKFTFSTTRDPGRTLYDLLLDEGNLRLYALTYFWGPLEPHAVGNVYVHTVNANGTMNPVAPGSWTEVSFSDNNPANGVRDSGEAGLPQFDPPDDTTLFAQHVLALDDRTGVGTTKALFIGGEGIHLYKATGDLSAATPGWQVSESGLTNLIMARRPILFSGPVSMAVTEDSSATPLYVYTAYVEDANGNPPIAGSTLQAILNPGPGQTVLLSVEYADSLTHQGTFRDPADATTDNPYVVSVTVASADKVVWTFEPECGTGAPGCSGADQELSFVIP